MCNQNCKICDNLIISTSVSVVTVDTVDYLVVNLPSASYFDKRKYCIVIAQTIPDTATVNMPVAFSIGGVTTTVYPFLNCNCTPVTAAGIRTRFRYPVVVHTSTTSGVFRALNPVQCYSAANLPSIPTT